LARFLFVVPPFEGHINPTISIARQLVLREHVVAWVGHPSVVRPLLSDGEALFELDEQVRADVYAAAVKRSLRVHGLESMKFLYEDVLLPLARGTVPTVRSAVEEFRPDIMVCDQQAFAGAIVARQLGLPWASLVTTSAGIFDSLQAVPKVRGWRAARFAELERENGLQELTPAELSPFLVIVFSTEALVGDVTLPSNCHFVGPSISDRPGKCPFPCDWLSDKPRVLVTLGTVNMERGDAFFKCAIEAFREQRLQIIVVAPESFAAMAPPNILIRPRIPQLEVLNYVQAVVCHGGHNTVCEALARGLPLVITPIRDDQPVVADQVVKAGAGIRLKFRRLTAVDLRDAVQQVLEDKEFRQAAARIGKSFAKAGGAVHAALLLERFAREDCKP
jgi:MGT family glycosyltransferase